MIRALAVLALIAACSQPEPAKLKVQARRLGFSAETSTRTTLLSEPAAPDASITTGVNLPAGTTADPASIVYIDEAFGDFQTVSTSQVGTWFTVTARNTGPDTEPLAATFSYGATP